MTGLFLSIEEYVPDPISMEIESAIAKLRAMDVQEEYVIIESRSN
jgi:hypothetical protein